MKDLNNIAVIGRGAIPTPGGFSHVPVSSNAVRLADHLSIRRGEEYVDVSIEDADIRIRVDGSIPTATQGRKLLSGSTYRLSSQEALLAQVIAVSGTANLQIQTYNDE